VTLSGRQTRPSRGSVPGMTTSPKPYRGFRFPAAVVEHFLSAHSHVQFRRYCLTAHEHRTARDVAFHTWREVVGAASAA